MQKFRVIYADPPWGGDGEFGPKISKHYPLMKLDDICNLPIAPIADDDSVLVMWSTWTHLEGALKVIKAWGFEYVAGFPWIKSTYQPTMDLFCELRFKPTWGLGVWVRGCSEPVLVAKRGNAKPPDTSWLGLIGQRMQHSRKPDNLYQYCESMSGPYLELFARRERQGWSAFGNQVKGSIRLPTPHALDGATRAEN
jgi:N6-adenosine-specific RNA methylase IME4